MGREAFVLGPAVAFSLAIMSWIIWSERPVPVTESEIAAPTVAAPAAAPVPTVNQDRVAELRTAVESDPEDETSLLALATLYFEAQSFEEAVPWYEQALALNPDDVESSTNLGVSYFYAGSPDRAVEQFDHSLQIAPDHAQTLLSLGIVRAFGLDDVGGAKEAWERVIEVAPDSNQATAAREALTRVVAELEAAGAATVAPRPGGREGTPEI